MADTFREIVRHLALYCPSVPLPLCESWVRDRWRQLCESRNWSFLVAYDQFDMPDSYGTGTVSATNGSTTIDGVGTAFTSDLVGRQLKVAMSTPMLTIVSVESLTSLTVDFPWAGASVSTQPYIILQALVTPADDFLSFVSVVSVQNMWRLIVNRHDSSDIDAIDPRRNTNGMPYIVAGRSYSSPSLPGITPVPMFEMWPHVTSAGAYPYQYIKRTDDFDADTILPRVITGDVLKTGALADLCRWPGMNDKKNPMFNMDLASRYEMEWNHKIGQSGRQDNEIYNKDIWYSDYQYVPLSASFTQCHGMYEISTNI